ncbi:MULTISPECIES: hypothetical protein [Streptomyces diastaticus group]|nr:MULTISPECIES: hypothetical protein [Streptomyces diastaticus group]
MPSAQSQLFRFFTKGLFGAVAEVYDAVVTELLDVELTAPS